MEDIINRIDGQVQVIFEKTDGNQTYRDAIWMSEEEYANTDSSTIDSIKQGRYDNWLAIINALPTEAPAEEPAAELDNTPIPE
jgi:hypothetical protein